jgi:hypothetical protein
MPDNQVSYIEAEFIGNYSNATQQATFARRAVVYRTGAGNATLIGTVDTDLSRESQGAFDATIQVSGTNVLLRVTGKAGYNPMNWKVWYLVRSY